MHLASISVERGFFSNCGISASLFLLIIIAGGLWGIAAVFVYFAMESSLGGQGEGIIAAAFFPLFMVPWAVAAARLSLRILDRWIPVTSPSRHA